MDKLLNKKLAKWAGFILVVLPYYYEKIEGSEDGSYITHKVQEWYHKKDNLAYKDLPDFTQSLDACFKWLVPKLVEQKHRLSITYNNIRRPDKEYMYRVSFCKFKTNSLGKAYDKSLSLALCKAIEKLIDN